MPCQTVPNNVKLHSERRGDGPPLYAREVAARIPGAELVVFEGGGHLHNVENPQEFNRVTLDFLQRHSL